MVMGASADQKWSAALIQKMTKLADQGMSGGQIAKALGLTRSQVIGKMRRLGLKTKNLPWPKMRLNAAAIKKMTKLADQGLSTNQIGNALGLTLNQARYRIRQLGLKTNPRAWGPQTEKMLELVGQGMSFRQIAKALRLTRNQVAGRLRRLGVKTKNAPKGGKRRNVLPLATAA